MDGTGKSCVRSCRQIMPPVNRDSYPYQTVFGISYVAWPGIIELYIVASLQSSFNETCFVVSSHTHIALIHPHFIHANFHLFD